MKIAIINGPNLNFLGIREPHIYGKETLEDLMHDLNDQFDFVEFAFLQSNHEGEIIDFIQESFFDGFDGIVINPGAYAHTSIAIADALKSVPVPAVEVHISNVLQRESYRQHSYTAASCKGVISGLGLKGYEYAVRYLLQYHQA